MISFNKSKITAPILLLSLSLLGCGGSSTTTENTETPEPEIPSPELPALPNSIVMKDNPGGTFIMGDNNLKGPQAGTATEHEVTLSDYQLSETEISVSQYVAFLNAAHHDGLITLNITSRNGIDLIEVVGTDASQYSGKALYDLTGSRVMKDHDNDDGDGDAFTGEIEPENPLNISFIGYDETNTDAPFFIKDPFIDFDWYALTDYYDYTSVSRELDTSVLNNDMHNWDELNHLPTLDEVSNYPIGFVRWWGAKAFALYYEVKLPTEAQWEYAAKGGQDFQYSVHDGIDIADANWNQQTLHPALHHVRDVSAGEPNPYGLYNLGGNVWEWIEDNYAPYNSESVTDPLLIVEDSTTHAWRGGSWNYHQSTLETSGRFSDEESHGNDHFGFRIAN
jgi:formylglycine-generating enzyme required for sulfatase activity